MTDLVLVIVLGCAVLVILGALVGLSLNDHLRDQQIRRQAEAQRRIGEQWRELQARKRTTCWRCGGLVEIDPDDDPFH